MADQIVQLIGQQAKVIFEYDPATFMVLAYRFEDPLNECPEIAIRLQKGPVDVQENGVFRYPTSGSLPANRRWDIRIENEWPTWILRAKLRL